MSRPVTTDPSALAAPAEPLWSRVPPLRVAGAAERVGAGAFRIPTGEGPLLVTALQDGVRLRIGPADLPRYPILVADPEEHPAELSRRGDASVLRWADFELEISDAPLAFQLKRGGVPVQGSATDGHFVREHRLPPFARLERGWFVALDLHSPEPVYGLGEKWGRLDKRGQWVRSEVFDALGVNGERAYKNTPFAWSPGAPGRSAWGLFVHTPACVMHAVGHPLWSQRAYGLVVEEPRLDLFLLAAEDGASLLRAYTDLTGRAPTPPYWSFGAILSKAYYRTGDEILEAARAVRARGMPCDVITFDGRAWQDTDSRFHFGFDPKRYPDPKGLLDELKALDFKVCVWEYPLVSVDGPHFADFAEKGWLLRDRRSGEPYRYAFDPEPFGQVLTQLPVSGIVDFTHPDAYAWWRDAHETLFAMGVDMIKSDFGEQVEPDCLAHNGDEGARLHNVYPLLYNACVYEAAERYGRTGAFLFGRAGWAGSQRYPVQWGGDPQADWEGMAASIRGGLSWGLSGGPFHASDIGGFYKDRRDPELYVRWTQAAIFISHLRFHGIGAREPWSYGPEADAAVRAALDLRYRLLPYLWETAQEATRSGMPVQRAMALAFPQDPAAWAFEEQWMCGPDLLVAACPRPGGVVQVYLPDGRWTRFPGGGAPLDGGRVLRLALRLDEIAVFAREGAAIPLGPAVRSTAETGGAPKVDAVWRAATPP
ncbi:glycoside hydrolase family 31 protein [Alsobacter sp. SYSU BS001988]